MHDYRKYLQCTLEISWKMFVFSESKGSMLAAVGRCCDFNIMRALMVIQMQRNRVNKKEFQYRVNKSHVIYRIY